MITSLRFPVDPPAMTRYWGDQALEHWFDKLFCRLEVGIDYAISKDALGVALDMQEAELELDRLQLECIRGNSLAR